VTSPLTMSPVNVGFGPKMALFSGASGGRMVTAFGLGSHASLLAERYAAGSANKHLAALRGVLRKCSRLGRMTAEEERSGLRKPRPAPCRRSRPSAPALRFAWC
jgi:hypothetical protein